MPTPISVIPAKPRVHRTRRRVATSAPVVPLTLVEANWEEGNWVRMTFDRAIDVSAMVVADVIVDDNAGTGWSWVGTGTPTLVGAMTVQVELVQGGPAPTPDTTLSVTGGNGVVAIDDGGTWAGVLGLMLPFS